MTELLAQVSRVIAAARVLVSGSTIPASVHDVRIDEEATKVRAELRAELDALDRLLASANTKGAAR